MFLGRFLSRFPWGLLINTWFTSVKISTLLTSPIQFNRIILTNECISKSQNSCMLSYSGCSKTYAYIIYIVYYICIWRLCQPKFGKWKRIKTIKVVKGYAMKAWRGRGGITPLILNLGTDTDKESACRSCRFTPRENTQYPFTKRTDQL
jgi:hypothetical protein